MPLRDFVCAAEACGHVQERFFHASAGWQDLRCETCGSPVALGELSAGRGRKTGVFPFTADFGDGVKREVGDIGQLRSLERRFGVFARAFSQEPSTQDQEVRLPEYRPGGRAYEGFRFPDHVKQLREKGIRDAVRAVETGRYRR